MPVPLATTKGISDAIAGFGAEALPGIYDALERLDYSLFSGALLDILGEIGDNASIKYLITAHKQGGYLSGTAAIVALRKLSLKLSSDEGYEYLCQILVKCVHGDEKVFNSTVEILEACSALGEWNDPRAIEVLKASIIIRSHRMPQHAIEILSRKPELRDYLIGLAKKDRGLTDIINHSLNSNEIH
jgi:hypothetical protein